MRVRKHKTLAGVALVTLSAVVAQPAAAVTAQLNIDALVLASALGILAVQDLDFGAMIEGGAGGSVTLDVAGVPTYLGSLTPVTPPIPQEGVVKLVGNSGVNVIVSVTDPTVSISNGTSTMKVSQFNVNTNAGGQTNTFLLAATTQLVPIGARLSVNAAQPVGTYTGTFTVQAVYQ